jgi:hypothetical protein
MHAVVDASMATSPTCCMGVVWHGSGAPSGRPTLASHNIRIPRFEACDGPFSSTPTDHPYPGPS